MSACRSFYLVCDGCGRKSGHYLSEERLVKELTARGWAAEWPRPAEIADGGRLTHYCPRCAHKQSFGNGRAELLVAEDDWPR